MTDEPASAAAPTVPAREAPREEDAEDSLPLGAGLALGAVVHTLSAASLAAVCALAGDGWDARLLWALLPLQAFAIALAVPLAARAGLAHGLLAAALHLAAPTPAILVAWPFSDASAGSLTAALAVQVALALVGLGIGRLFAWASRGDSPGAHARAHARAGAAVHGLVLVLVLVAVLPLSMAIARRLAMGAPISGAAGPLAWAALRLAAAPPAERPSPGATVERARADLAAGARITAAPAGTAGSTTTALGGVYRPGVPVPLAFDLALDANAASASASAGAPPAPWSADTFWLGDESPFTAFARTPGRVDLLVAWTGARDRPAQASDDARGRSDGAAATTSTGAAAAAADASAATALALAGRALRSDERLLLRLGGADTDARRADADASATDRTSPPPTRVEGAASAWEVRRARLPAPLAALRAFDAVEVDGGASAEAALAAPEKATLDALRALLAARRREADPRVGPALYRRLQLPAVPHDARIALALGALVSACALAAGMAIALLASAPPWRRLSGALVAALALFAAGATTPRHRTAAREDVITWSRAGHGVGAAERLVHVYQPATGHVALASDRGLLEPVLFERPELAPYAVRQVGEGSRAENLVLSGGERRVFRIFEPHALAGPLTVTGPAGAREALNRTGLAYTEAILLEGRLWARRLGPLADGVALSLEGPSVPARIPYSALAVSLAPSLEGLIAIARAQLLPDRALVLAAPLANPSVHGPAFVAPGWFVLVVTLPSDDAPVR